MKQSERLDSKGVKIVFGLFLLALLLLSRDTLVSSCLVGFTKSQFLMLGLLCLAGVWFLWEHRKQWKQLLTDRRAALMGVSAAVLLIPMVGKGDWQMMYFSILLCLLAGVFLSYLRSLRTVARYYVGLMAALGAYSLLATYGLKELAAARILPVGVFLNSKGWDFYNFGLAYVVTWETWIRNFGIFREPGVYQFFLMLGLYLNNYQVEWEKEWQTWGINAVLAVTMLSTFSVVGIGAMGLFAVVAFFEKGWHREKIGRRVLLVVLVLGLTVGGWMLYHVYRQDFQYPLVYEIYDLFHRLTADSESATDRFDAVRTDVALFLHSPLLGDTVATVLHSVNNNTSSSLILYAMLGLGGGTLNVLAWVALVWEKERRLWANLALLGVLVLTFNTQNLVANVFFWLFPMMALAERGLPWGNIPEKKERE